MSVLLTIWPGRYHPAAQSSGCDRTGDAERGFPVESMPASRPPRPHSGVGTVSQREPSEWTITGPYESVPTAQTSLGESASTPTRICPGTLRSSVHADPFQCSTIDRWTISYPLSRTRAPTAHASLADVPETSSSGYEIS